MKYPESKVAQLIVAVLVAAPLFKGEKTAIPVVSGLAALKVILNKVPLTIVPEIAVPFANVPENAVLEIHKDN